GEHANRSDHRSRPYRDSGAIVRTDERHSRTHGRNLEELRDFSAFRASRAAAAGCCCECEGDRATQGDRKAARCGCAEPDCVLGHGRAVLSLERDRCERGSPQQFAGKLPSRVLAMLHVAMHDAIIATWDSKYAYNRRHPSEVDATLST